MYIEKTETENILHSEQGFDLVDKEAWNNFVPTEEIPVNDTYRFKIAWLPYDMSIDECQYKFLEIKENE